MRTSDTIAVALEADVPACRPLFHVPMRAERLGTDIGFGEGPVYDERRDRVIFSDIASDARLCWDRAAGVRELRRGTHKSNGLDIDAQGSLLACEHSTSMLVRWNGEERSVLASHWQGHELNSPNDVAAAPDGSAWFTDPVYGRSNDQLGRARPVELGFQGVYRLLPGGELELVSDEMEQPNGLCFSPDSTTTYVSDTARGELVRFRARDDGRWSPEVLADGILPQEPGESRVDGMTCDAAGNIWLTGPGGLWIFDPGGTRLGLLRLVGEQLTNVTWMGADRDELFITSRHSIFRLATAIGGPDRWRQPDINAE